MSDATEERVIPHSVDEALACAQDDVACWMVSEDGHWCPSCGELIARPEWLEDGARLPEECPQCGYPDADAVAGYHLGPDWEDDDDAASEGAVQ